MFKGGVVHRVEGVVTEEVWLSLMLFLNSCWRQLQVWEFSDLTVGEDHPELVLDELSHFLTEEQGMLGSGLMASSFNVEVTIL